MFNAKKLERALNKRNRGRKEFAEAVGITYYSLANYINGYRTPQLEILCNMAKELQVPTDYLLDYPSQNIWIDVEDEEIPKDEMVLVVTTDDEYSTGEYLGDEFHIWEIDGTPKAWMRIPKYE